LTDAVVLAIDAGNTRVKWGVHDGRSWRASGAVATSAVSDLERSIRGALPADVAIACNVAGDAVEGALERACAAAGLEVTFIRSPRAELGVVNGYREAQQLGPDRWAALVAAHALERGHKLVVNAGTALTVDALTAEGKFLGGLIVPGPELMRRSLDRGTAGLRLTEGKVAEFPQGTADAIASGAIQACAGAIDRLAAAMASHGTPPDRIILSGGAAAGIAPWLRLPTVQHDLLVLEGLARIARHL
jgi:type III pantothenate kinase